MQDQAPGRMIHRAAMPCSSPTRGDFRCPIGSIRALFTSGVKNPIGARKGPGKSEFATLFCEFVTFPLHRDISDFSKTPLKRPVWQKRPDLSYRGCPAGRCSSGSDSPSWEVSPGEAAGHGDQINPLDDRPPGLRFRSSEIP